MRVTSKVMTTAVVISILVGFINEANAMTSNFASTTQTRQCGKVDVKITAATSQQRYAAGTSVKMIGTILNVSSRTCTVAVGGTSPSMTITNATRVVVWDNCYSNDQPGMCPQYLALRTLKSGGKYSTTRTWNQHIGGKVAPRGTYEFILSYAGLANKKTIKIFLTK